MIEAGGSEFLAILIVGLASYRLTRIVTADSILHEPRQALYRWAWDDDVEDGPPVPRASWRTYVYELLTCGFCLGIWVTVATYAAWRWGPDWFDAVIFVAAAAGVQAYVASRPDA